MINRLVVRHELSKLEATWLLKTWQLGGVAKTRDSFSCYLAGFKAALIIKAVERELKSERNG